MSAFDQTRTIKATSPAGVDPSLLALANHLADVAGEVLKHYWRKGAAVEHKADASPVTRADRECESAIAALIEKHLPDHGIIGEEHGAVRPKSDWQWVIDPIDGTRSFIAGFPIFTTLIALTHKGVPVLGLIDQPITTERWLGAQGEATTMNGKFAVTSTCEKLAHATLATTSTDYFTAPETAAFSTLAKSCANVLRAGDAYAYAMLASGQVDIVIDSGLKPYDFCALVPVVEGAGGIITDWEGNKVTLTSGGRVIASANEALHEQALKIIGD